MTVKAKNTMGIVTMHTKHNAKAFVLEGKNQNRKKRIINANRFI